MNKKTSQPINYDKNSTEYWKQKNPQYYTHDNEPALGIILLVPIITAIIAIIWTVVK